MKIILITTTLIVLISSGGIFAAEILHSSNARTSWYTNQDSTKNMYSKPKNTGPAVQKQALHSYELKSLYTEPAEEYEVMAYALDKHMRVPMYAGIQPGKINTLTKGQWEALNPEEQADYNFKGVFCGREYYFGANAQAWMDAHGRYNHELVFIEKRPEGPVVVCE